MLGSQLVLEYPAALRERIVQETLWGAEFALGACRGFAASGDIYNAAGCMTRVAQLLVQLLFALNRRFFVSDKYAGRWIGGFSLAPREFMPRLAKVLGNAAELNSSCNQLAELWQEVVQLTGGDYQPRYNLAVLKS